jgi:Winged helix domain, variant/ATPase family associated with various cellular activities (AAA)
VNTAALDTDASGASEPVSAVPDVDGALGALDRLLRTAIELAEPLLGTPGANPYRGLYVASSDALEGLEERPGAQPIWAPPTELAVEEHPGWWLGAFGRDFALEQFDLDVIALALAPELDLRYERIYAYLQDDITRKRPTVSLALDLFSAGEERLTSRSRFAPDRPLIAEGLIELVADPQSNTDAPLLAHALRVDQQVIRLLLGERTLDPRLAGFARVLHGVRDPTQVGAQLADITSDFDLSRTGTYNLRCSRRRARVRIAMEMAGMLSRPVLCVDLAALLEDNVQVPNLGRMVDREARIFDAVLFVDGIDALAANGKSAVHEELLATAAQRKDLTLLGGEQELQPGLDYACPVVEIKLGPLSLGERRRAWSEALTGRASLDDVDLDALAARFRFAGDQIADSVDIACAHAARRGRTKRAKMADLVMAARAHAGDGLATLSQRIDADVGWHDIVIPADQLAQLREICSHARFQHLVFEEWGFGHRLPLGTGLSVLFAGPPGTGKTMAASIVAAELGAHLYRIDLSQIVDKYIGETEKRLERVFTAAEASDAILFFDECDALFGKRSEVKDAHDRFANIEVAYLLQRMESFDGISILATNLRNNLDSAFLRRLRFVVDFPHPDETQRVEIWRRVWPKDVRLKSDVDFPFLARQFELSGGQIRNVALAAAFRAAGRADEVGMGDLVTATRREFQKAGRLCVAEEFGEYRHLLRSVEAA